MINNQEEYSDPVSYDIENDAYTGELDLLTEWAIKQGGPIIDLACGTGRMTIPLAQKGFNLIGVDIHAGMLELAKKKADEANIQIVWLEQDCTELQIELKSPFIYMVGNSFQHFHSNEQQNLVLRSIHNHLEKDGIFIFGTRFPNADELLQPSTEEYWKTYTDTVENKKVDVYTISNYNPIEQIQHYTTIRKYLDEGNVVDQRKTNISLRYTYPKEMERLLSENGLDILHVYEDWKKTPLSKNSYEMIYVCRKE
ncbi:Methyltransferase domain-containing protein [Psychrobacillus sp. OK028]|uniref:class I SAM-dependent methyltransferase n=1 Tax=Psychrobacillus sp. OK028 TaxID=1884359 RepID=UPI0008920321|nr:class I SAM-dependent methyltransferase [Psychrobacillus sp. OK028]SDM89613.1 Methyltransferase domain-containing protein [Psychrobacillus sp. OK028]